MGADDEERQFPALAISDILILTLSIAFTLACIAPPYHEAIRSGNVLAWDVLPDLLDYLAIGIYLFGLIVLARQRIRGSEYAKSPGHWVLAVVGPYSVIALTAILGRPFISAYISLGRGLAEAGDNILFVIVIVCSIAVSLKAVRVLDIRWTVCLVLTYSCLIALAMWLALDAANSFGLLRGSMWRQHLIAISTSFEVLAGVSALVACVMDRIKRVPRDWLHYCGIIALVLGAIEVSFTWGLFTIRWWRDLYFHLLP
jgi:hypothetical protein